MALSGLADTDPFVSAGVIKGNLFAVAQSDPDKLTIAVKAPAISRKRTIVAL